MVIGCQVFHLVGCEGTADFFLNVANEANQEHLVDEHS